MSYIAALAMRYEMRHAGFLAHVVAGPTPGTWAVTCVPGRSIARQHGSMLALFPLEPNLN